ncbi:MAG: hypothetical protein IPM35_34625 [Myxococcales bacterium]|nr:hypothetical protein [Myxococcales bacterium]
MTAPRGASSPPPAKRRRRRRQIVVRGDLRLPAELMAWERDLLLPTVLRVLAELLPPRGGPP